MNMIFNYTVWITKRDAGPKHVLYVTENSVIHTERSENSLIHID
jgi:hypothetical protein